MYHKLRFVLPVMQVVLAFVLTMSNEARPFPVEHLTWRAPDAQIRDGLNAPAAIITWWLIKICRRIFHHNAANFSIEMGAYFLLVFFLWYYISIEINRRYFNRSS